MEYYSAMRKKDILPFATIGTDPEGFILSETSQTEKDKYCMVSLTSASKKEKTKTLAGVGQWIECQPENRMFTSLIPSQGTCLGCGPGPQLGACEKQPTDISFIH